MNSPIKWIGGKKRFLNELLHHKNMKINNYYEPFFGSGSLFFHLENIEEKAYINDLNYDLINFYIHLRDNLDSLYILIKKFYSDGFECYGDIRDMFNASKKHKRNKNSIINAARFYYLNKFSFNGIYRVNSAGGFNVPLGSARGLKIKEKAFFQEASKKLQNVIITSQDWKDVVQSAAKGDLVYLDPPYFVDESSKFLGYNKTVFCKKSQFELIDIAKKLVSKGVWVMVSNSNSKEFKNIMMEEKMFHSQTINVKRNINPKSYNKDKFVESLYCSKK